MTGQHIPDDRDVGKVFHEMLLSAQNNGLIKFFSIIAQTSPFGLGQRGSL